MRSRERGRGSALGGRLRFARLMVFIPLMVFAVIQVFPIYYLVVLSLKTSQEVYGGNVVGLPKSWAWSNYVVALVDAKAALFLANSLLVTAVTIVGTVLATAMVSYAIVRIRWKLAGVALAFFLLGLMVPQHSALLPLFVILRKLKLLNTYLALILPYIAFSLSMGILVFAGFLEGVPREIEEAAFVDGCSVYRCFFQIVFPLLAPAAASVAILTYILSYNELMFAVTFISKTALKTLTVGIVSLQGRYATNWGAIGASCVVALVPTLAIYLALSDKVQKGLTAGALKA